jgi:hypothetical protein
MAVVDTEALWFRIISVLVVGFFLGLFIANAVYFDRIVREPFSCTVTKSEAQWLFWFNVIWAVIAAIFFVWAVVRLFWHASAREEAASKVKHYVVAKAAKAKAAAGAQFERTDVGFGRTTAVPRVVINRQDKYGPRPGSFSAMQVPPPVQTEAIRQQVYDVMSSPRSFAPALQTASGVRFNPVDE